MSDAHISVSQRVKALEEDGAAFEGARYGPRPALVHWPHPLRRVLALPEPPPSSTAANGPASPLPWSERLSWRHFIRCLPSYLAQIQLGPLPAVFYNDRAC